MLKRLAGIALGLAVIGVPAWWMLTQHSPAAGDPYPLDLPRVRALAESLPGPKPSEIRYEDVMALRFYEGMLMAGDPWVETPMPVYSYQLVYPDRTILVDTALARSIAKPEFLGIYFNDDAYQRMNAAMAAAEAVVITHEHMDHIGGIATHPQLAQILPRIRLTVEQVNNPKGMDPAELPADVMRGYQPLHYDVLHALAPGVVLIKAPGHTPGSQMVYVRLADAREVLFLGDVSWRRRNIEHVRERPLLMTLLIGEDRGRVLGQFQALHDLAQAEPGIALVPGHDGPELEKIAAAGFLKQGFRLP